MNIKKEEIISLFEKYLQVENTTTCYREIDIADKPCLLLDEFEEKLKVYLSNILKDNINIEEITYNSMNNLCNYKKYNKEKRTQILKNILKFDKIINRYDNLMSSLCFEGSKIDFLLEQNEVITIKDLVKECKYCLSLYYEENSSRSKEEGNDTSWVSEVNKLKRFINRYDI